MGGGGVSSPPSPPRFSFLDPQTPFLEIPPPHVSRGMTSAEGGVAGAFPIDAAMPIYGQAGAVPGTPPLPPLFLPGLPGTARPMGGHFPAGERGGASGAQGWFGDLEEGHRVQLSGGGDGGGGGGL